jgi:hypothetical protein
MSDTNVTIPSAFVPLAYLNDPETEELVYGDALRDGMVVLLEETILRANPDNLETRNGYEYLRILETARWCMVTNVRFSPAERSGRIVKFIGVYADGTKSSRSYHTDYTWYVKRASMV